MYSAVVTDWLEFEQMAFEILDSFVDSKDEFKELIEKNNHTLEQIYKEFSDFAEDFIESFLDTENAESLIIMDDGHVCEELYRRDMYSMYILEALGVKNEDEFIKLLKQRLDK
jgi:3-methyladenine DNA glycosylase AlkC